MNEVSLDELLQWLAEDRKVDLRGYKAPSLQRRLRHRMFQVKQKTFGDYLKYLQETPGEENHLLNAVLINVTEFFRDQQGWEVLRREVIPALAGELKPGAGFRAWSAGCASGEEAYSLAILLREHFGENITDYDVKVYATDVDDDALNTARRGEYSLQKLRHVRPQWIEKYFHGPRTYRVTREVRRLCIFGHANLVTDAPISHVQLLLCRNVLIYFNAELQRHILKRLHYALDPGGILMLGNSESHLSQSKLFGSVNPKWRIFRRLARDPAEHHASRPRPALEEEHLADKREYASLLKTYQDAILKTLEPGILILDNADVVITENESALRLLGLAGQSMVGKKVAESAIAERSPEIVHRLEALHRSGEPTQFDCTISAEPLKGPVLRLALRSISTAQGGRAGTLVYLEDVTIQQKLQITISELETTSEELQASNEELETANEELQSTNEELETTNEELNSTNEELETTNEELQALNEELGTTNEELEARTQELDEVNARYVETVEKMPWPVMMVDSRQVVQVWNSSLQRLFGLAAKSVVGLELEQLPVPENLRRLLAHRSQDAARRRKDVVIWDQDLETNSFRGTLTIRIMPLTLETGTSGTLIMLEPTPAKRPRASSRAKRASKPGRSPRKKNRGGR